LWAAALGGLLAGVTSPRTALTVAGLLLLPTPLLLPRRPVSAELVPGGRRQRRSARPGAAL
jgi:hypothetical protein